MAEHSCPHCMEENMSAHEMAEHMMIEHPDKQGAMSAHGDKEMNYHK